MFTCETCGKKLYENASLTSAYYDVEIKHIFSEDGLIDKRSHPEYFIYSCHACGFSTKVSIEQLIKYKQEFIVKHVLKLRLERSIIASHKQEIHENSGISYCGMCPGVFDGDGYCSNDLILKCVTRREILDN